MGTEVKRYDVYCHACRSKDFYIPPTVLDKRVKEGLIRPERRKKIGEQRLESRNQGWANAQKNYRIREKKESWAPAQKSLAMCRYIMRNHKFQEGCAGWVLEMQKLIFRSADYIKAQKKLSKLPSNRVVFWYDVAGLVDEYRALVRAYPLGEENCPLQIF